MKRYIVGLFLILLIAGCQQPATITPEPTGQAIVPETAPAETVEEETEEVEEEAPTGADVSILGKEGFDPEEITVKEGATIVFMNNDPNGKDAVLTFQKGRKFINSDKIKAGEKYEQVFDAAGTYDYWTVQYGVKGKIVVE